MAANKWELTLTPDAFIPDATNHPSMGVTSDGRMYLAFDADTPETCYSKAFRLPDSYSAGSTTVVICYRMATATANEVEFEVSFEAITPDEAYDLDSGASFASAKNLSETVPSTAGHMSVISTTFSQAEADSMAAGDMVRIRLARDADDATNDDATGDAHVFLVAIYEA